MPDLQKGPLALPSFYRRCQDSVAAALESPSEQRQYNSQQRGSASTLELRQTDSCSQLLRQSSLRDSTTSLLSSEPQQRPSRGIGARAFRLFDHKTHNALSLPNSSDCSVASGRNRPRGFLQPRCLICCKLITSNLAVAQMP